MRRRITIVVDPVSVLRSHGKCTCPRMVEWLSGATLACQLRVGDELGLAITVLFKDGCGLPGQTTEEGQVWSMVEDLLEFDRFPPCLRCLYAQARNAE